MRKKLEFHICVDMKIKIKNVADANRVKINLSSHFPIQYSFKI